MTVFRPLNLTAPQRRIVALQNLFVVSGEVMKKFLGNAFSLMKKICRKGGSIFPCFVTMHGTVATTLNSVIDEARRQQKKLMVLKT